MTDKSKKPLLSMEAQAEEAVREARRAASLRANIGRRKEQSAAREDAPAPDAPAAGEEAHRSFFAAEADEAVREARREAALRANPVQKRH